MTRQAATWSERDLDRRFELGEPRDELTELAATLDGLLDRLAASLRHEQRFSAELSHELRTPLSRVLAETELALRRERAPEEYRETLEQVHRNAEQLNRTIDALLAAARYEAGTTHGTADALDVATEAASVCAGLATDRSLDFEIARPDRPIRIGVEADYAERILQPVFENACRYGASSGQRRDRARRLVRALLGQSTTARASRTPSASASSSRASAAGAANGERLRPRPLARAAARAERRRRDRGGSRRRRAAASSSGCPPADGARRRCAILHPDAGGAEPAPARRARERRPTRSSSELDADACAISRVIGDVLILVTERVHGRLDASVRARATS